MSQQNAEPTRILADKGFEVWMTHDSSAEVYELFASDACDDYIGCADTPDEALTVAREWIDERASI
jgi:hypothetical protein